jgi:alpha-N-arabinofuranosidase
LAHEQHFICTPIFHVFAMYAAHQGAQGVRAEFGAPSVHAGNNMIWGLNGSASLQGKSLTLTVVNPSVNEPRETQIHIHSAAAVSANATVLTSSDIHAHNTFEQSEAVTPKKAPVSVTGSLARFVFPPASVTKLQFDLS